MARYTGKSVDEVLGQIVAEKGCKLEEVKYEVIEEKKSLLGFKTSVIIEAYTPVDVKEFIFDYLGSYFSELDQEVSIEIIVEEDAFKVILDSENNAILIGKGGQTLRAIATVLKAAVNNNFKGHIFVNVDVGNYKKDRYSKVCRIASRVAKDVKRSHINAELDPMPSDERRVIHQYLTKYKNIKTESEGEGSKRHIVIKYVEESDEE